MEDDLIEPDWLDISEDMLAKVGENETAEWRSRYGDLVWARIYLAHPWWPAKICDLTELSGEVLEAAVNCVGKRYCVYFYGSNNCDFALPCQIIPYAENAERLVEQEMDKSLLKEFRLGVKEANGIVGHTISTPTTTSRRKGTKRVLNVEEEEASPPRSAKKSLRSDTAESSKKKPIPATQKKRFSRRKSEIKDVMSSKKSIMEKKCILYDKLVKWQESTPDEVLPPFPDLHTDTSIEDFQFSDAPDVPMGVEYTASQQPSILNIDDSLLKSLPAVPSVCKPVQWSKVQFDASPTLTHLLHHSVETQRHSASYNKLQACLDAFNQEHGKTLLLHVAREEYLNRMSRDRDVLQQYSMVADETVSAQSGLVNKLREQLERAEAALGSNASLYDRAKELLETLSAAISTDTLEQKRDARQLFVAMAAAAMNMEIDLLPTSSHPLIDAQIIDYVEMKEGDDSNSTQSPVPLVGTGSEVTDLQDLQNAYCDAESLPSNNVIDSNNINEHEIGNGVPDK